jgi:hypothetical protein
MRPSHLVTAGGVRRHTVRGMSKTTKAALAGGVTAAAIAATVGIAAPASASYGMHRITSVVEWGGADCIAIEGPYASNPYLTGTASTCNYTGVSSASYSVPSGALAGANPIMGHASWISCEVYIDGGLYQTDYASAGDGHDANCLWRVG